MKNTFRIVASYCGFDGNLASRNVFCLMQDAITVTLGEMGCDNITLRDQYHSMWVFTKQKAKVYRRPTFNEEVRVNSRIVKSNRLVCYVKTEFRDINDQLLIEGMTECCILDKLTFRFVRLTQYPLYVEEEDCDTSFDFDEVEPQEVSSCKITYSLTDMSMHLNNALALNLILNTFSLDEIREIESHPYEIALKYNNQAMHNTVINIGKQKIDNGYLFKYFDADRDIETGYIKY